ncbi:hypothetical protein Bbelb_292900 [Branchiostoma belcheri]|nr:hypothetical protein Bbelb_292900 [Branchiostoma belcheri]
MGNSVRIDQKHNRTPLVYLTTHDGWAFYQILATGQMTNPNVKATCEATGMRVPCYSSGTAGCTRDWTSGCITYDDTGISCDTQSVLASKMCGTIYFSACQPLHETFVYRPDSVGDDSAYGVCYTNITQIVSYSGSFKYNKHALCAVRTTCDDSPCVHGACTDGNEGYVCTCESGWTGRNCDDIDDCASSPCAYGTCTDGVASYTCSCENGWTGNNCDQDIDECLSSPCAHGTCTDGVESYTCSCENGWTGNNCDQVIDDCLSSPCAYGTCIDGVASYTCSCENGWTGNNCDLDIDDCASNPCWLGGTCLDHVNGYSCVCPKETTGKDCKTVWAVGPGRERPNTNAVRTVPLWSGSGGASAALIHLRGGVLLMSEVNDLLADAPLPAYLGRMPTWSRQRR